MKKRRILIIAGEASGDLQAAHLVKSLKSINPNIEIFGIGGNQMKKIGDEVIYVIGEPVYVGFEV